jgi:hypothetical protein
MPKTEEPTHTRRRNPSNHCGCCERDQARPITLTFVRCQRCGLPLCWQCRSWSFASDPLCAPGHGHQLEAACSVRERKL